VPGKRAGNHEVCDCCRVPPPSRSATGSPSGRFGGIYVTLIENQDYHKAKRRPLRWPLRMNFTIHSWLSHVRPHFSSQKNGPGRLRSSHSQTNEVLLASRSQCGRCLLTWTTPRRSNAKPIHIVDIGKKSWPSMTPSTPGCFLCSPGALQQARIRKERWGLLACRTVCANFARRSGKLKAFDIGAAQLAGRSIAPKRWLTLKSVFDLELSVKTRLRRAFVDA